MEGLVVWVFLWFLAAGAGFPVDQCRDVSKGTNITLFTVPETDGFVLIKHDLTMKFEILDGKLIKSCSNCIFRDGLAILTDVKPEDAGIYHFEHMDHGKTSVCLHVVAPPDSGFPVDQCRNVPRGTNITLFTLPETDGFVLIKHDITMKFEILDGELTKSCSNCVYRNGLAILTDVKPEDAGIYHLEHMDHGKTSVCLHVVAAPESGFSVDQCRNVSRGTNITLFTITETDGFVLIKHDLTMKFEILDGELSKSCSNCVYRDGRAILMDVKPEDAGIYHFEHMDHGKTSVCLHVVAPPESGDGESGLRAVITCGTIVAVIVFAILICRSRKSCRHPGPGPQTQKPTDESC